MSAAALRRAATLMRERAEAARARPLQGWFYPTVDPDPATAYVIAWHPAVSLAVADLLDHVAHLRETAPTVLGKVAERVTGYEDQIDAVARAYLGEPS